MSQIVTPPDIRDEHTVYLIVNANPWDVEMVIRWLKVNTKQYTIHLYHGGMEDTNWLNKAAMISTLILVNKKDTIGSNDKTKILDTILDFNKNIRWFGEEQEFSSAAEYLVKNG